jgi:hypothetical protein
MLCFAVRRAPCALRLPKVFLLVTPLVSKSAPGGEYRLAGQNKISICNFSILIKWETEEAALATIFTPCLDKEWNLHHCALTLQSDPSQTPDNPPILVEGKMKIP